MIYEKECPKCNKNITYSNYKSYFSAKTRNSSCRSCRTITANKSLKRNSKLENNPAWKGYKEIPYSWFSRYFERKNNRNRKITGNISIYDVYNLWIKQNKRCALTNLEIGWNLKGEHTCSIDRIDSNNNYNINNIQLVHKDVNIMKNKFDQNYFIQICKLITLNNDTQ